MEISGKGICSGVAVGPLFHVQKTDMRIPCQFVANPHEEYERFTVAQEQAISELNALAISSVETLGKENAQLFEIHAMMLKDSDYQESIENKIIGENLYAPYALQETADEFSQMFENMNNDYMKARAADVVDVSNRVIDILLGKKRSALLLNKPSVLYAEDFTPSETAQLDREKVLALLTEKGSANSHTAIFARTMGIPAIISLGKALADYQSGTIVGIDGDTGNVYIDPKGESLDALMEKMETRHKEKSLQKELFGKTTETLSGRKIRLYANIGSSKDITAVIDNDAEGIGLFRSEFLYLESDDFPAEQHMFESYKIVAEKMNGRQVIIRTLDIGADKQAHYFNLPVEENPAMGMRAIRICLTQPKIFKTQLRAILRASAFGYISIMFPMITSVAEVTQAKQLLQEAKEELSARGVKYDADISVGIMIETPASVIISDLLAKEVDFFSIGTNDLTQYTLAVDRQNDAIADFCDPHHIAVLRLIEMTAKSAKDAGIWVGICGELASDISITKKLLEIGIDELSVSPSMVLPLREYIRKLA